MAEYENHLYAIIFPNQGLITSQLGPGEFGKHYAVGSSKHFDGKVVFVEIDKNLEDGFFPLNEIWKHVVPHEDGTPKRTKFAGNYRVLENIPLDKFKDMYLVTVEGKTLKLSRSKYTIDNEKGLIRVYQMLNPIQMLVGSRLDQRNFGEYFTRENTTKGCPTLCYTQVSLDVAEFERIYENDETNYLVLPNIPNNKLKECIEEMKMNPEKKSTTISLASIFQDLHFRKLRHGFWIASGNDLIFYPLPGINELENEFYDWYRSTF